MMGRSSYGRRGSILSFLFSRSEEMFWQWGEDRQVWVIPVSRFKKYVHAGKLRRSERWRVSRAPTRCKNVNANGKMENFHLCPSLVRCYETSATARHSSPLDGPLHELICLDFFETRGIIFLDFENFLRDSRADLIL